MKKKTLVMSAVLMFGGVFVEPIFAANLIDVYKQALKSDPTFKAANGQWLAARENLPINRASLLPQLSANAGVSRIRNDDEGVSFGDISGKKLKYYNNNTQYTLTLTQQIFNFSNWAALWGAKASVKQAQATFASAAQDLMFRVANAYFAVLQAQDNLRFTLEHKKAVGELLRQDKQKFDVGLIPITDLNNAQASYDTTVAQEIADRTNLADSEEKLQEITGIKYTHRDLYTLRPQLPFVKPVPQNMEQWVKIAERQNYTMLAAHYGSVVARENIAQQEGGHLPTLDATGSFGYQYDDNSNGLGDFSRTRTTTVGLQLTVPLFSGGRVSAQARQASHLYQQAISIEEQTHRSVVSQTRQAYLGVVSGISKIQADRQGVKSKQSVLTSTQNSYTVGLRTMKDVLDAESDLYDAEKIYATDQYAYIMNTITLKQQAGTLSADDLAKINLWLEKSTISLPAIGKDYRVEQSEAAMLSQENPSRVLSKLPFKKAKSTILSDKIKTESAKIDTAAMPIATLNNDNATSPKAVATTTLTLPATVSQSPVSTTMAPTATAVSVVTAVSAVPVAAAVPAIAAPPVQQAAQPKPQSQLKSQLQPQSQSKSQSQTQSQPQSQVNAAIKAFNTIAATAPEVAQKLAVPDTVYNNVSKPTSIATVTTTPVSAATSPMTLSKAASPATPVTSAPMQMSTAASAPQAQKAQTTQAQPVSAPMIHSKAVVSAPPMSTSLSTVAPVSAPAKLAAAQTVPPLSATPRSVALTAQNSSSSLPVATGTTEHSTVLDQKADGKKRSPARPAAQTKPILQAKPNAKVLAQNDDNKPQHLNRPERYILKKVDPKHYAVQLMTSSNKQELVNFAYDHGLQDKTILYAGIHGGAKYYGLIYGDYENVRQANFAMHKLTSKLDKKMAVTNTKIVQFKVLQEELKISH